MRRGPGDGGEEGEARGVYGDIPIDVLLNTHKNLIEEVARGGQERAWKTLKIMCLVNST